MRMLLITPTMPHRGGIAQFGTLLAHQLSHRHQLITWGFARLYPAWLFPGSTAPDPSHHTISYHVDAWLDGLNPLSWWQSWRTLPPIDLIIWQWWTPFWLPLIWFVTWQARRCSIPTLVICHQLVEPDAADWQAQIAVWALHRADAVLFLGSAPPHWPTPHRTIHLPALTALTPTGPTKAIARQQLQLVDTTPVILSFGFVRDYKGLDTIIHAMAHSHIPYHLVIAGEWWPLRTDIRHLVAHYNLTDRVHIHDNYIPNEQVACYFAAADLVVLPYRSGTVSGVAGLAHQFGVPIITSDIASLAGALPPIARLPADDVRAWRQALDTFFMQPSHKHTTPDDGWTTCIQAINALADEIQL
jgi:glycosyltransferase involved in cell wall biosynthesis